jgi:hypothetical protein
VIRSALLVLTAALVVGCGSATPSATPGPTTTPSPTAGPGGAEGLAADLTAGGATVKVASQFAGDPFQAQGFLVCVNGDPVRIYQFATPELAEQAAKSVDPADPSHIGTAIVEWFGSPRFWRRDRVIVNYSGSKPETEAILTALLGNPFARGEGRPPMVLDACA